MRITQAFGVNVTDRKQITLHKRLLSSINDAFFLVLSSSCHVRHISGADVHGGARRRSGSDPDAADLPGDAVQVLQDRAHALLQEPLWKRGYRRR